MNAMKTCEVPFPAFGAVVRLDPTTERLTKVWATDTDVRPCVALSAAGAFFSIRNELWAIM